MRSAEILMANPERHGSLDEGSDKDLPGGMFRSGTEPKLITATMQKGPGVINVDLSYTEVGGLALFEGDIVLATVQELEHARRAGESRGIGIVGNQYRWPNGIVPYEIASEAIRSMVEQAIAHWHTHSPIRLVTRKANDPGHKDYISFEKLDGCWSRVGRQGGMQQISLGSGCGLGAAIHEIGHALGLWHEQSRSDRDDHVTIVKENIHPSHRHNFDKHVQDGKDLGVYDYGSIMHYPPTAFSINGQATIVTKAGQPIGQRNGLSPGDRQAIRLLYPTLDWSAYP
jgi:Astacin (Peptidase family M12A)